MNTKSEIWRLPLVKYMIHDAGDSITFHRKKSCLLVLKDQDERMLVIEMCTVF